jgi:hypothetical protein
MFSIKCEANWLETVAKKENVRAFILMYIYMIKTQAAHQQNLSFLLPPFPLNSSCASFILNPL